MLTALRNDTTALATAAIAVSSLMWGVYWLPLRLLDNVGIEGGWPALAVNLAVVALLLPVAVLRWRRLLSGGAGLFITGLLIGSGLALYGISVVITDVVRAILLFYMSPVWSTILGVLLLNEKLGPRRIGALIFGFLGLMVILEADIRVPLPERPGDWMALAAGLLWSIGSLRIFQSDGLHGTFELSFSFITGAAIVGLVACLVLPAAAIGAAPTIEALAGGVWILGVTAVVLMLPVMMLTMWGTRKLTPARVGILLMGEILAGVASAAVLSGDPFGLREVLGAALVLAAGLLEVLPRRKRAPPAVLPFG